MLKRHIYWIVLASAAAVLLPALAWAGGDTAAAAGSEGTSFMADGWLWAYLGAFGVGIVTSLTPCVYPMIPIVVAVFGARDEQVGRAQAFLLATAYVLGMGVMYAALGVVFALLGKQFGSILADPRVVIPLVLFYAALAASMFGAFELNLPPSVQARLNRVGGKGYGGAFGMGLVGGLTAAPCTGPFLAGILAYVATTGDVYVGSSVLFTYALGMGVLFWVIAAFAVSLPKSGAWMEGVKSVGGIALLAVGIHFLRPIVPAIDTLTSTSPLFLAGAVGVILVGLLLGAVHLSFHGEWSVRIRKSLGVLLVVVGTTAMVSTFLTPDRHLPWHHDEDSAFAQARAEGKGVMIDFAATWCNPCKELELTFAEEEVYGAISARFVPLKFDVSKGTAEDEARQARWRAETLPAVIFVDADGNELGRVSEYLKSKAFMKVLGPAAERIRAGAGNSARADNPAPSRQPAPAAPAPAQADTPVPAPGAAVADPAQTAVSWLSDEKAAFARAAASGKGVLIDFYSTWCMPCTEMDESTFQDGQVADGIAARYVPLRMDVTADTEANQAAMRKYSVNALPTLLFLDATGSEQSRITRFVEPRELLAQLDKLGD